MSPPNYANLAVFRPIRSTFEYSLPDHLKKEVTSGSICRLPFRGETVRGIVLEVREEPKYDGECKKITELVFSDPLPETVLDLAEWLAYTTLTPIGQVLSRFVPGDLSVRPRTKDRVELNTSFEYVRSFIEQNEKRAPKQVELLEYLLALDGPVEKKGLLQKASSSRSPLKALTEKGLVKIASFPKLSSLEAEPISNYPFEKKLDRETYKSDVEPGGYSLYAVNGSGDRRLTAYLEVIRDLGGEGTVLVLAPNVARAEELTKIVRKELGSVALSYHSNLTDGELSSRWKLARAGNVEVFVGVLNAIYLPVPFLRGIIVEGEGSRNYDLTEQDPKGNVVETARKRAELEDVPLLLGDTGPSIRTFFHIVNGELRKIGDDFPGEFGRTAELALGNPERDAGERALSTRLRRALKWSYGEEEPALIIGSKTGTSSAAVCDECGEIVRCSDCEVPLTFISSGNYGVCPYCGSKVNLLVCNSCGSDDLRFIGSGLEKAETEVRSLLPGAEVRRFDFSERTQEEFLNLVSDVLKGEVDVLLGTKIIASLYFQGGGSLVGLLDLALVNNRPSYRSTEFLLRRVIMGLDLVKEKGKVVLQTRTESGGAFDFVKTRDWKGLYDSELRSRQRMGYPPAKRLIKVEVESRDEESAKELASKLKERLTTAEGNYQLLGPTRNPYGRRKGRYQSDLIVKTENAENLLDNVNSIVSNDAYEEVRLNPFA